MFGLRSSSFALIVACCIAGCGGSAAPSGRMARLSGTVEVTDGARGAAWLFLYPPGMGPPLSAAFPEKVSAVSDDRLRDGDTSFVFANVEPNTYRLWGFLDVNLDFEPKIDVLGGPGAGDRIAEGLELNVQPGAQVEAKLPLRRFVTHEPPAFVIEDAEPGSVIELRDQPTELITLTLKADALGLLDPTRHGFVVGLGDADGDGVPDDANGDQLPDLFPRLYLRFLRKPGQVVPLDSQGRAAEVLVPLAFNPGPFLANLANDPERIVVVDTLQAWVVPQAQAVTFEPGRGRVMTPMDAIPVGDYELWVEHESGQFWRIPNDLGTEKAAHLGGPFPSQAVRFRFVHQASSD